MVLIVGLEQDTTLENKSLVKYSSIYICSLVFHAFGISFKPKVVPDLGFNRQENLARHNSKKIAPFLQTLTI